MFKKTFKFSTNYTINGQNALVRYSNGVSFKASRRDSALELHTRLILAIVKSHNDIPMLSDRTGKLKFEDIVIEFAVRLD